MKRFCSLVYMVAFVFVLYGQDYERIDATIQLYPERFDSAEELSAMISRDFVTEEEKVRGIYTWLIQNISYDPDEYKRFNYNFKNYRERNAKEEKSREQIIERTLRSGIAVCEGYAMLFEKLCTMQGITNYLVRGDIKTNFDDIGRPFKRVHMWNVARIDGEYFLFDATWGAGKYRDKFIKEPTYFYYKTPPELFVKTHFPDLPEDTLLSQMISREVFASWPLVIDENFTMNDIVQPYHGVIDAGNTLGRVDFSLYLDPDVALSYSFGREKNEIAASAENGIVSFSIPFQLGESNLLIYFNDKPAMAYKIK